MNNNIKTKDDKSNSTLDKLMNPNVDIDGQFQQHKLVIAEELINKAYKLISSNCDDWGCKTIYENRDEKQRALQNLNETQRMIADLQIGVN